MPTAFQVEHIEAMKANRFVMEAEMEIEMVELGDGL